MSASGAIPCSSARPSPARAKSSTASSTPWPKRFRNCVKPQGLYLVEAGLGIAVMRHDNRKSSLRRFEEIALHFCERMAHSLSRSEEHTSELQSRENLVCRLLLEKKKKIGIDTVGSKR